MKRTMARFDRSRMRCGCLHCERHRAPWLGSVWVLPEWNKGQVYSRRLAAVRAWLAAAEAEISHARQGVVCKAEAGVRAR